MAEDSGHKVLVVDDHEVVRFGLCASLAERGFSQIREASGYICAKEILKRESFTIFILDRNLGDGDGIILAEEIRKESPEAILLLLTIEAQWSLVEDARRARINAVIDKTLPLFDLIEIINRLIQNPSLFISTIQSSAPEILERLTKVELEVLIALETGARTREIAQQRFSSEATIKTHLTSIYRKLEVRNRVEAIAKMRQIN